MGAWRNLGIYFGLVGPTEEERSFIESGGSASPLREFVAVAVGGLLGAACMTVLSDASIGRALIFGFGLSVAIAMSRRALLLRR